MLYNDSYITLLILIINNINKKYQKISSENKNNVIYFNVYITFSYISIKTMLYTLKYITFSVKSVIS